MKKHLLFLVILLPLCVWSQTFRVNLVGSIPDYPAAQVCFPLVVSGVTPTVLDTNFGLISARIKLTHTYDGDLYITLRSPDGNFSVLSNREGGSGHNFDST